MCVANVWIVVRRASNQRYHSRESSWCRDMAERSIRGGISDHGLTAGVDIVAHQQKLMKGVRPAGFGGAVELSVAVQCTCTYSLALRS